MRQQVALDGQRQIAIPRREAHPQRFAADGRLVEHPRFAIITIAFYKCSGRRLHHQQIRRASLPVASQQRVNSRAKRGTKEKRMTTTGNDAAEIFTRKMQCADHVGTVVRLSHLHELPITDRTRGSQQLTFDGVKPALEFRVPICRPHPHVAEHFVAFKSHRQGCR